MTAVFLSVSLIAMAQAGESPEAANKSAWVEAASGYVAGWTVAPASEPDHRYALDPVPVFRHVQHVRGDATGSLFVWRDDSGRPVAICDVFFLPASDGQHSMQGEWHSLASAPLSVRSAEGATWVPEEGLAWKPIPETGVPDASAERRKRQLRQLSRRFSAHIVNRAEDRYQLRFIPTPLAKYETPAGSGSLGGALFAFCQENDPEVLLLIEAREAADGLRWEYAIAEFSNLDQHVQLDGDEVWQAAPPTFSRSGPHWARSGGYVRIAERTDEAP